MLPFFCHKQSFTSSPTKPRFDRIVLIPNSFFSPSQIDEVLVRMEGLAKLAVLKEP
jgi:hypothetical protein